MLRWLLVALCLLAPSLAGAATPCREIPPVTRTPSAGSPFVVDNKGVTTLDTQTSDKVRLTGGCIDVPELYINGLSVAAGHFMVVPGASIQDVLTRASNGGTVYIMAGDSGGNYTITSPLIMSSGTSIVCEKGVTITATSVGWTDPNPDPDTGTHRVHILNANHGDLADTSDPITDHDLSVQGCNFATAGTFGSNGSVHAIQFRKAKRIRISGNTFMGGGNATAMIASEDTVISDNSMSVITTGDTHSSTTLDGLKNTQGVAVGTYVAGPGIPDATTVLSINSPTSVTLSAAATATASGAQIIFGPAINACYDHWEGTSNFTVRDNTCGTVLYGVLATGSDTNGAAVLTTKNGNISGNKIAMGTRSIGGGAAIFLNGLGLAGSAASNIKASANTVVGDGTVDFYCWKVSGGGTANTIAGNTCSNSGTNSVGAAVGADGGGTPTKTTFAYNTYDGIKVDSGSTGVIQISAPHVHSVGERIYGGSYPNLIFSNSTDTVIDDLDGEVGTGARINVSGATRPVVCESDPSDGTKRCYQNFSARASSATINIEDTRNVAAGIGGALALKAKNSNSDQVSYASINASAVSATPAAEAGDLVLKSMVSGGLQTGLTVSRNAKLVQLGGTGLGPMHFGSTQLTVPALSSCGSNFAISGTDFAGEVTMGTGSPTGCVITFNAPYAAAPYCTVTWQANLASMQYTVSATAITLVQTATSSNKVNYRCTAQSGG